MAGENELQPQVLSVPFASGVKQQDDPRWLDPGAQTSVINGQWVKRNQVRKRLGFGALTRNIWGGGTLSAGAKIMPYRNEIAACDGAWLYSYSPTAQAWVRIDRVSECVGTREGISQSFANQVNTDVAELAGYRVFTWESNFNIYVTVKDSQTGSIILQEVLLNGHSPATNPRVVYTRNSAQNINRVQVVWFQVGNGGAQGLYSATWDPLTQTAFQAPFLLEANATCVFDLAPSVGDVNGSWLLVWESTLGVNRLRIDQYSPGGVSVANTQMVSAQSLIGAFAVRATAADSLGWVAYTTRDSVTGNPSIYWRPVTLIGATPAPGLEKQLDFGAFSGTNVVPINLGLERATASSVYLVYSVSRLVSVNPALGGVLGLALLTTTTVTTIGRTYYMQLKSRPFLRSGRLYAYVLLNSGLTPGVTGQSVGITSTTECLVDLMADQVSAWAARPVTTLATRVAGPAMLTSTPALAGASTQDHVSSVTNPGVTNAPAYVTCGAVIVGSQFVSRSGLTQVTLDFSHPGRYMNFPIGDALFISGGVPCFYDGATVVEAGYMWSLDSQYMFPTPTGGGNLTASTLYSYVWVLEWVDAHGEAHREQASQVIQAQTTIANLSFGWVLPTMTLTMRQEADLQNAVYIGLVPYRTASIAGTVTSNFFRALAVSVDSVPSTLYNQPTVEILSAYIDTIPDNQITSNPTWLEQPAPNGPGLVAPQNPPSFVAAWNFRDRVMGIGDDQETIWFSGNALIGEVPRFSDGYTFPVFGMGQLTAGGWMDDKCVIFSATSIAYFTGAGPNDTNQNSDFSPIERVQTDVGCTNANSVVACPLGLAFLSARGLYLLGRGLDVSYIGGPVVDSLAANPYVTSGVLVPSQSEVRWTCLQSASSSTGVTLRWNYVFDAWSVDVITDPDTANASAGAAHAALVNGVYTWLTPSGRVYQESPQPTLSGLFVANAFTDAGTWVTTTVSSASVRAAGLAGWGRWWFARWVAEQGALAEYADVTATLYADYGTKAVKTQLFKAGQIAEKLTPLIIEELACDPGQAMSYRIQLSDAPPTGGPSFVTGQGYNFVGFDFEYGVHSRGARLAPQQRA